MNLPEWLELSRGTEPLIVSLPHTGPEIPLEIESRLASSWLARKDTDWRIELLYDFAAGLGATVIRTRISRTVVDVNRDPSGVSLYPGMTTTELCPTSTFDGEPLYLPGCEPSPAEIALRREVWFDPYHALLAAEVEHLRAIHGRVVVYDCHSIRSVVPRLFDGELPHFNIGTNGGQSCDPRLPIIMEVIIDGTGFSRVTNGRFRGGYITRHFGRPDEGVHAVQMELAMRGYLNEPIGIIHEQNWPPAYDPVFAAPMRSVLMHILEACKGFAGA